MHIGTQLMVIGTGARTYYTPWLPKGADNAVFIYELVQKSLTGSPASTFTVTGYTKNREDAGSEGTSFSFSNMSGSDFWKTEPTNLKQLVRFKITLTPGTGVTGPDGVCYRFLPPTWYDKAV
jgi:hypothetical protein